MNLTLFSRIESDEKYPNLPIDGDCSSVSECPSCFLTLITTCGKPTTGHSSDPNESWFDVINMKSTTCADVEPYQCYHKMRFSLRKTQKPTRIMMPASLEC